MGKKRRDRLNLRKKKTAAKLATPDGLSTAGGRITTIPEAQKAAELKRAEAALAEALEIDLSDPFPFGLPTRHGDISSRGNVYNDAEVELTRHPESLEWGHRERPGLSPDGKFIVTPFKGKVIIEEIPDAGGSVKELIEPLWSPDYAIVEVGPTGKLFVEDKRPGRTPDPAPAYALTGDGSTVVRIEGDITVLPMVESVSALEDVPDTMPPQKSLKRLENGEVVWVETRPPAGQEPRTWPLVSTGPAGSKDGTPTAVGMSGALPSIYRPD